MSSRYPVQIQVRKEANKLRVKAATSVEFITREGRNPDQALRSIEMDCTVSLSTALEALSLGGHDKRRDPRACWFAAKALTDFLERLDQSGFYLIHQNKTLGAALGLSGSSIKKLLAFCKRFPDLRLVDPSILWAKYRDNEVPRKAEMSLR